MCAKGGGQLNEEGADIAEMVSARHGRCRNQNGLVTGQVEQHEAIMKLL